MRRVWVELSPTGWYKKDMIGREGSKELMYLQADGMVVKGMLSMS